MVFEEIDEEWEFALYLQPGNHMVESVDFPDIPEDLEKSEMNKWIKDSFIPEIEDNIVEIEKEYRNS